MAGQAGQAESQQGEKPGIIERIPEDMLEVALALLEELGADAAAPAR